MYGLDGISFKSTQAEKSKINSNDRNVVLFSKSATVKFSKNSISTRKYSVDLFEYDEGDSFFYPRIKLVANSSNKINNSMFGSRYEDSAVISLDPKTLVINHIKGVSYDTNPHDVSLEDGLGFDANEIDESEF